MNEKGGDDQGAASVDPAAFELLLSVNPLPMWVYDLETLQFLAVNDAAVEQYGYTRDEFLSMRITDIRPFEDLERLEASLRPDRDVFERSGPWRHITAGGRVLWTDIISRVVEWQGRRAALVASYELPTQTRLGAQSTTDVRLLSDISAFSRVVAEALRHASNINGSLAVCVARFQGLERLALASRPTGGYVVVEQASRRLAEAVGATGTAARVGVAEFAWVAVAATDKAALKALSAIVRRLREPLDVPSLDRLELAVSVGVRLAGESDAEPQLLVEDAALAVGEAAELGPSVEFVVYDETLRHRIAGQVELEAQLRAALSGRELGCHYQAVFDIAGRHLHGWEALLRWSHPTLGALGPEPVVRLAEGIGLIGRVDAAIRRVALAEMAAPLMRRSDLLLSLNLSPIELADPELPVEIDLLCRRQGVDPAQLCLELTETALVPAASDSSRRRMLLDLKRLGVRLAIDDFGTGYSALSYLKTLPVDIVKIDRSFVTGIEAHPSDHLLVEAIATVCHSLGLTVVAEGVETEMERAVLEEIGVDQAQGYLFARPVPFADLRLM